MTCNNSLYYPTFICKECGKEIYKHRLENQWQDRLCPDCLNERRALLSRKQILRKVRFKVIYMYLQAVRMETYRLKREREYRNCPTSVPGHRHWSNTLYSTHKIQMRVKIHKYVESLMLKGCTKCGNKWKLKGVCDGPEMDGPTYYTYCINCDSGFTLDYNRGGAICIA